MNFFSCDTVDGATKPELWLWTAFGEACLRAVAGTCVHKELGHVPCAHLHQEIVLASLHIEAFGFSRQKPEKRSNLLLYL